MHGSVSRVSNENYRARAFNRRIHLTAGLADAYRTCARASLAAIASLASCLTVTGCSPDRLDENLCPIGQPVNRNTILLLDTSDPLSAKHREEFRRLVTELQEPGGPPDFRVAEGEALIVYELHRDTSALDPIMKVCNPGDRPDDWGFREEVTSGKAIALSRWKRFSESVEPLFEVAEAQADMPQSPIIEHLGVIVPRHAPSSRRRGANDGRTHLIVFSDLLQHSEYLSHYGEYPAAEDIRKTTGLRQLQTDLSGVEVSLLRLERGRHARWQTRDHYYWWTHFIESLGGKVIWQESI